MLNNFKLSSLLCYQKVIRNLKSFSAISKVECEIEKKKKNFRELVYVRYPYENYSVITWPLLKRFAAVVLSLISKVNQKKITVIYLTTSLSFHNFHLK